MDDPTNPSNPRHIIKRSANQLLEEICNMPEERTKAHAIANIEYALVCFKVDQRRAVKNIKDVSFNPLPATSISDVKMNHPPPRSSMVHDECAEMLMTILNCLEFKCKKMLANLWLILIKWRKINMKFMFSSRCIYQHIDHVQCPRVQTA
jgi:hypothetical protein